MYQIKSITIILLTININCFGLNSKNDNFNEETRLHKRDTNVVWGNWGTNQDDPELLSYIRSKLVPPSTEPYNLAYPGMDPGGWNGINVWVRGILKGLRNGFFIESGANNGELASNTLLLEKEYGWSGLLIEPSPLEFPILLSKHRKAYALHACISPKPVATKFEFKDIAFTPGNTIGKEVNGTKGTTTSVDCFPIFSVLAALSVSVVDYFSLDIEGVEMASLHTIPFDSILIKIFSIEYNLLPEGKKVLLDFMKSKGYVVVLESYHDYIFVHKSIL